MLSDSAKAILKETHAIRNRKILRADLLASLEFGASYLISSGALTEQQVDKALAEIDRVFMPSLTQCVRDAIRQAI